jgi:tetratricopeptide (TPR) repeat protein
MRRYDDAIKWYFKGIEKDKEYKAPHANLSDIYDRLKYNDAKISSLMKQYNIYPDYYYYETGLAYYDKKRYQ